MKYGFAGTDRAGWKNPFFDPEQRALFESDGFLIFDVPVVTIPEINEVRDILDPLFARFDDFPHLVAHNLGGAITDRRAMVAELEYVTTLAPALRRTAVVRTFRVLAQELYGAPVRIAFDHAIYKPAGSTGVTSWHQDSAYDTSGRKTITVWIALQDTDATNGCMRYVRGSQHDGPLEHENLPSRHGRAITTYIDENQVRNAQLPAGGAAFHREHAVHSAGANYSDTTRRTLILEFAPPIGWTDTARVLLTRAKIARIRNRTSLGPDSDVQTPPLDPDKSVLSSVDEPPGHS